jgi:hypothetical protein
MVGFQLVIDCADPDRLARFWKEALHYEFTPAPDATRAGTTTTGRWASLTRTLTSARTGSVTRRAAVPTFGSRRSTTSRS